MMIRLHSANAQMSHLLVRLALVVLVALAMLIFVQPVYAQETGNLHGAGNSQAQTYQTVLVHFAEGTTPEMRDAVVAAMGGELVSWMHQIQVAEIRLPVQEGVVTAALPAMAAEMVTYAENDMVVQAAGVSYSDPDLNDAAMNYGLAQVSAMDAWSVITGSPEIVIAVIDSGVKLDHPEFAGRLTPGYDFVNNDEFADDDMGHGTHVAGIIAAALDNGQGVAGVCPNCRLMPVKVLNENNMGTWSQLAKGILYAVDNGAQVLNLSLGAEVSSETLAAAVQYALDHDVVVVAAAGNMGSDVPFYPAALDGVIAVGAITNTTERWARSNFGPNIDLVAPGSLIYSTYYDLNNLYGGYTYMSGTSMAAPFVSGVAGLLLSANRELSAQQVYESLLAGAVDLGAAGWDVDYGYGMVSAMAALQLPTVGLAEEIDNPGTPLPPGASLYLPVLSNR